MFNSSAQRFCALPILLFLAWMVWVPPPVHASCADGRPRERETCVYPSIGSTITNEAAKADSLLIGEVPALARRLTSRCLEAERSGSSPPQCWQSAAEDARRFTLGVTGSAALELRGLGAVWADLALRLKQEQEAVAGHEPQIAAIEPAAESWRPRDFSSKTADSKLKKRKIAKKVVKRKPVAAAKKQVRRASASAPRVRKAEFNGSFSKRRHGLANRKRININKSRPQQRKPTAAAPSLKCLFSPKSCKS
jgi:hypothetical protein